jgi:hypothetical protein
MIINNINTFENHPTSADMHLRHGSCPHEPIFQNLYAIIRVPTNQNFMVAIFIKKNQE